MQRYLVYYEGSMEAGVTTPWALVDTQNTARWQRAPFGEHAPRGRVIASFSDEASAKRVAAVYEREYLEGCRYADGAQEEGQAG